MTINKDYILDTEQLVEDYDHLLAHVNSFFGVKVPTPENRVLMQILSLHFRGTLDNRIFNLFRQLTEDWEYKLLDLITDGRLQEDELIKLLNSTRYLDLKLSIESLVRSVYQGTDPNFTIWEVEPADDLSYVSIKCCGDYRIEQWHHEHNVTKLEIKDVISYDMNHLVGFIHKTFVYSHAPGRIAYKIENNNGSVVRVNNTKRGFYAELIKNFVGFKLGNHKMDETRFLFHVDVLSKQMIINPLDVEAKIQALDSFFELEVAHQLDKMSDFKQVTSFVISGEEIVINFGTYKSNERKTASFEELELQVAEANGDYVPERLRKHRG